MDFRAKIRYTTRWKGPQKKWGNSVRQGKLGRTN